MRAAPLASGPLVERRLRSAGPMPKQPRLAPALPALLLGLSFSLLHCGDASTGGPSATAAEGVGAVAGGAPLHPKASASLCLDVAGKATANGTAVQLGACNGSAGQQWAAVGTTLRVYGTKCLDVTDGGTANGAKLQIWDCTTGNKNQAWAESGAAFQWSGEAKCLDVTGARSPPGRRCRPGRASPET